MANGMNNKKDCYEILELLNQFLDNELDPIQYSRVQIHVENCVNCTRELDSLREVDAIGKAAVFPDPGTAVWNNQRKHILNSIKEESNSEFSRKTLSIHWTKKVYRSAGLRIAVSLSAAAVIMLFIAKDVYRNDISTGIISDANSEISKPEINSPVSVQKPAKQNISGINSTQDDPVPIVANTQKNIEPPAENVNQIEDKDISRQAVSTKNPVIENPKAREEKRITTTEFSSEKIDNNNDRTNISVIVGTARISPLRRETGFNMISSMDMRNQSAGLIQNSGTNQTSEIDFDAYLTKQTSINFLLEPLVRKERWILYLENVKDQIIRDLIIYDVYEIYNSEVKPESNPELKKEALSFLLNNREMIESIIGKEIFENRLQHFKNLN